VIAAADLERRLAGLDGIGARDDGLHRLAWTAEDAACRAWFGEQAAALGRRVETDPAGNLWALPDGDGPWWGVGSHLDSVRAGGRFDGPLGVATAFEVAARASVPVAVLDLADEEGARFNTPTFGSRALVARLPDDVLARADDEGVVLRDALAAAGVDPDGLAGAPDWLGRLRGFLELHIDQTQDLARDGRAAGVVSGLAARLRVQADLRGRADHAGTTRRGERADALSAAARLIVAAEDLAGDDPDFVVTAARILVEPNALTTVPAHVRLFLDARAPDAAALDAWLDGLQATPLAVPLELTIASRSAGIAFDADVREALRRGAPGEELLCFAGHDAGVLAERLPAGMVFVRNPSGISHSPDEEVSLDDAAAAAGALLEAVEALGA
jgi:N-carbamoyl-L-amino-acid hydrolase